MGRTAGEGRVLGQIKLSLQYRRDALLVMVHHARELPSVGGQEPSTYVKVYLRPDPAKATKRKTKVVRRSCHPSFMEMVCRTFIICIFYIITGIIILLFFINCVNLVCDEYLVSLFVEQLEYRLPLTVVRQRQLEATVWSRDPLQENEFLGGMILSLGDLPLSGETAPQWYSLGNVPRTH